MQPYNSCGNGSAMRIAPVGWAFEKEEDLLKAAKKSAECIHNHPEGIKGAQATSLCIYLARHGSTPVVHLAKRTSEVKCRLWGLCGNIAIRMASLRLLSCCHRL